MSASRRRMFGVSMLTLLAGARAGAQSTTPSATTQPAIAVTNTSTMRGVVTIDTSTTPIADAEVQFTNLPLRTKTDSAGRFSLAGIPVGRHHLLVRRLGYEPFGTTITIQKSEAFDVDIGLNSTAQMLREIEVKANAMPRTLHEFYENKRFGFGTFITPDVFQKYAHYSPDQILIGRIPGITFRQGRSGKIAFSPRGGGGRPCAIRVSFNGLPPVDGLDLGRVQTQDILAVEYYTSATMPAIYRGTTTSVCALMVVRTK